MEFIGGRSHRMAAWTHIRERENEGRTEDGGVVIHKIVYMYRNMYMTTYLKVKDGW